MILHPVVYFRDFQNDFSQFWETGSNVAAAVLPILSLHRAVRGPVSLCMSGVRCVTNLSRVWTEKNRTEQIFHGVHAALAAGAVGLCLLHPTLGFIPASVSDALVHSRKLIEAPSWEALHLVVLDLLFLATFCYGAIELTVAALLVQILLDLHLVWKNRNNPLEVLSQTILTGAHVLQLLPQLRLLQWKLEYKPVLSAELKQDPKGFVYLDIPDEWLTSLQQLHNDGTIELPPYFGDGKVGAHISVILSAEMQTKPGLSIADLGKRFEFQIVHADAVTPANWVGVDKVHFLTIQCPALHEFRTQLGLSPRIEDHDFHLTFGIQRK